MAIRYSLFENYLTSDPDDYSAKVYPTCVANLEDVIDRMVERGSTVTRADILSVMDDFELALQSLPRSFLRESVAAMDFLPPQFASSSRI